MNNELRMDKLMVGISVFQREEGLSIHKWSALCKVMGVMLGHVQLCNQSTIAGSAK